MKRKESFLISRKAFEADREALMAEHGDDKGKMAVYEDGKLIKVHEGKCIEIYSDPCIYVNKWPFRIHYEEDLDSWPKVKASDWELICNPFLDTDTSDLTLEGDRILQLRGYSRIRISLLRFLALTGVWWNVFWWEWAMLDHRDIQLGWGCNMIVIAVLMGLLSVKFGIVMAGLAFAVFFIGMFVLVRVFGKKPDPLNNIKCIYDVDGRDGVKSYRDQIQNNMEELKQSINEMNDEMLSPSGLSSKEIKNKVRNKKSLLKEIERITEEIETIESFLSE
jgi:hypothetical protein